MAIQTAPTCSTCSARRLQRRTAEGSGAGPFRIQSVWSFDFCLSNVSFYQSSHKRHILFEKATSCLFHGRDMGRSWAGRYAVR